MDKDPGEHLVSIYEAHSTAGQSIGDLKADIRDTRRRIESTIALTTQRVTSLSAGGPSAIDGNIGGGGAAEPPFGLFRTVRGRLDSTTSKRLAMGVLLAGAVGGFLFSSGVRRYRTIPYPHRERSRRIADVAAILFDVDGTLIDSNAAHAETWAQALREYGFACDGAQVRPLVGMGGDKLLPRIADIDEDSTEGRAITKRKKALFTERLPHLAPTPGARALLAHLQRIKKDVIVATSADDHEMGALLEQAGVADLIPRRTSKDDASHSKPDPDIVQAALNRAGVPAARALMIGDTPYDIEAARRAGVESIALRCGGHWSDEDLAGAIAVLDDPATLLSYWQN